MRSWRGREQNEKIGNVGSISPARVGGEEPRAGRMSIGRDGRTLIVSCLPKEVPQDGGKA